MAALDLTSVRKRANGLFKGFTRGQIAMLAIALAGTVVGAFLFLNWASTTTYASLYSGLSAKDAASVTQELTARGVQYQLANGGATIMVPEQQLYQLRLDLSAKGLPESGATGWDLLDKQGLTTSDFRQRVDFQRALEGELSKTIGSLQGVKAATVHLVIPRSDIFSADDRKPSASVLVATTESTPLSSQQVKAIVHLVASSVEGLTPEQVTLADAKGRVLSAAGNDPLGSGDDRADQNRVFEQNLARQLTTMLESVTGPGKAKVTVTAALDFDRRQTTTERFPADPNQATAPVVRETTNDENYAGTGTPAGGPLGPVVNAPQQGANGAQTTYTKKAGDKTYAVGKVTESFTSAPGAVKRLSVAVLVDEGVGVDEARVGDLVRAASGYDEARGDLVQVTTLPFDETVATDATKALDEAAKAEEAAGSGLDETITTAATVFLVSLILLLAWRSAKRPERLRKKAEALAAAQDKEERERVQATMREAVDAARALGGPREVMVAGEQQDLILIPQLIAPASSQETRQINDLIERQPDDVARMLRTWLADRRG